MNSNNQQRNPVLLVHGIDDTGAVFYRMGKYLKQLGWSVYALDLVPNNGALGLDKLAKQVADYVAAEFPPEQPLDVVGFSMGGIVSRYYIQRLEGIKRVQRFITISSPHNGTVIAYGTQRPGCVQMRPNSAFLKDLNSDVAMLQELNFTSIWTPYDLMIVPAKSSQLPVGKEVVLPIALHPWMLSDARCLAIVAEILTEPIKRDRQFENIQNFQKLPLGDGNT
ncbi:esterase/lipase family protein [Calothrix sp. NIES-2098]|uniref:esterase/lipase family protein n=1 Tax=Calothrix sp. NIES-2098 TaxID=1954171 RepID=UPI000B60C072|nr:lipase, class 2 [Calothrix sp. NIES-2098]